MADENEQQSVLKVLVELVDQVTEPLRDINERFEAFGESVHGMWAAAAEVFAGYEAIEGLIEPATAFAQVQAHLALATRASAESLAEMKEQAEKLSESYPSSLEQITEAQTALYQTFRNMEDVEHGTEVATKLATVLGVDASMGARILSSAVQNLGEKGKDPIEQMQVLGDKISTMKDLFPAGAAGAARMATELGRLGTVAQQYNLTQNQTFAIWGELNRLNKGGMRGGAQQAVQIIEQLAKVNEQGISELSKYGVALAYFDKQHTRLNLMATIEELSKKTPVELDNIAKHLTGPSAAIVQLAAHFDDLHKSFEDFAHSSGEMNNAADAMANTPQARMERLRNSVANLGDTIGTTMLPQLIYIVDRMSAFIHSIDDFLSKHPMVAKALGDIAAGLAAMLTIAGLWKFGTVLVSLVELTAHVSGFMAGLKLLQGVWAVTIALFTGGLEDIGLAFGLLFESNPLGWIVTGVAAIALGSYEIYKHWDAISGVIERASTAVEHFFSIGNWREGLDVITGQADKVGSFVPGRASNISHDEHTHNSETHLHYMEGATVSVQVGTGADGQQVGGAVRGALDQHTQELMRFLDDSRHQDARRSFGNPALEGAR